MSESKDYASFRRNVVRPGDRIDRIENIVTVGMPDINFCSGGKETWIELKSPREPKRNSTPLFGSSHKLSQDQMNWFKRQHAAGGSGFVLIATDLRWILMSGDLADFINLAPLFELIGLCRWHCYRSAMSKQTWAALRNELRR